MFLRGRRELLSKIKRRVPRKSSTILKSSKCPRLQAEKSGIEIQKEPGNSQIFQNQKLDIQRVNVNNQQELACVYPQVTHRKTSNKEAGVDGHQYMLPYQHLVKSVYATSASTNDCHGQFNEEHLQGYDHYQSLIPRTDDAMYIPRRNPVVPSAAETNICRRQNIVKTYGIDEWNRDVNTQNLNYESYRPCFSDHRNLSESPQVQHPPASDEQLGRKIQKDENPFHAPAKNNPNDNEGSPDTPLFDPFTCISQQDQYYGKRRMPKESEFTTTRTLTWTNSLQEASFHGMPNQKEIIWLSQGVKNEPSGTAVYNTPSNNNIEDNTKFEQNQIPDAHENNINIVKSKLKVDNTPASTYLPPAIHGERFYSNPEKLREYPQLPGYNPALYTGQVQSQRTYPQTSRNSSQTYLISPHMSPISTTTPYNYTLNSLIHEPYTSDSSYITDIMRSASLW